MTLRWILGSTIGLLLLISVIAYSQDPAPAPSPLTFKCIAQFEPMLTMDVIWSQSPFEALRIKLNSIPRISTDNTPPVITKVEFPGTISSPSVLDDSVRIPAGATSLQFRIAASDDIAVQSAFLYVDGYEVSRNNGGAVPLAANGENFAVRWNASPIAVGWHELILGVCDSSGNCAPEKTWRMQK